MYPLLKKITHSAATVVAASLTLLFSQCDSALSDVEVTDPGLLQTHFTVERTMQEDGSVIAALQATILDKNLASVELKNAQVKVNGQAMTVAQILGISTYHIPSATVDLNKAYTFEIILPNGQSHTGTVTTQAKTFTSITAPATSNANTDLTVSWQDVYAHDEFIITLNLTSPAGTVAGPTFNLTSAQMQAGTFVIPKSSFATPAGITSVTLTFTGVEYGTIDPKFRSGSGTIARMRAEKKVMFN